MSRIMDFLKTVIQPANNNNNELLINLNNSIGTPSFIPSSNAWANGVSNNLTNGDNEKRGLAKEYNGGKVNVPVYQNDSQWDVVKRSLGMFADQANLSGEAKQAFVQKWTAELERTGQTSIYGNNTGNANSNADFAAKINSKNANKAIGLRGTFEMTIRPNVQTDMIGDLRALHSSELSTARIKDPQLRQAVKSDLRDIIAGTGTQKTDAAQELINRAAKGQPEADAVYQATKAMANRDDLRLNATLKTAELRMDLDKLQNTIGPNDTLNAYYSIRMRAKDAVMSAMKGDWVGNTTGATGRPNRAEAAWVNKQVAVLLTQINDPRPAVQLGNNKEAAFREMLGRFYEVTDEERASLKYPLETSLPRWKELEDGSDAMRADTKEEQALRKFEKENKVGNFKKDLAEDPQKRKLDGRGKIEAELNKNGALKKQPETQFAREGSLKEIGQVGVTTYRRYDEKGREVRRQDEPYQYKKPQTTNIPFDGPELRPKGVTASTGTAAFVGGLEEVNKWGPLLTDLWHGKTRDKIKERKQLEDGASQATHFPIPPKLEELPKVRAAFEQQLGTEKAAQAMQKLEELSHAFWNK